ncbi:hypothetical protein F5882DRAFT_313368 [Hyaloscypha sp. PMI_1271]|nr:hypothetical protein F5882DRAFT_313368 [Hyaloscypha sp. PMI_1271]
MLSSIIQLLKATGRLLEQLFYVIFVPWQSTSEPIRSLLNAVTELEQNELTSAWRDRKLGELSFVGVTCAIVAAATATAFTWPEVPQSPWSTKALWHASLALNITAICVATQQTVALHRLSCYADGPKKIRSVLGEETGAPVLGASQQKFIRPRWSQLYVWQTAVMLLNFGVLLFAIGLVIFVFDSLGENGSSWSSDDIKVRNLYYPPL